jgi:hypothetical protein
MLVIRRFDTGLRQWQTNDMEERDRTFDILSHHDPVTGEDEICIVATELGYFRLEQDAQRRGKSVQEHLFDEMAHQLRAHGFNISPDCFYVTTERPDEIDTGKPLVSNRVTLQ